MTAPAMSRRELAAVMAAGALSAPQPAPASAPPSRDPLSPPERGENTRVIVWRDGAWARL
jgi:hypothetical protein